MSLVKESYILEFNNSFLSKELEGKPIFDGGYVFGITGSFNKKEREHKDNLDYYLEVKCSSILNPTGSKIIREAEINSAIQDDNSFSFFIKNYSAETKSSMFRGDLTILGLSNEGGSFDNLLVRNSEDEYYLKTSNGQIGGEKYITNDTFRKKTFYVKMSENQGQKIFGMNVQYVDGELSSMTPQIISEVNNTLSLTRDAEGDWNATDSYSTFVPLAVVDMDTKSTTNFYDSDVSISDGGTQLGLNGQSGPIF